MFYLAVVLEKGQIVDRCLDAQNEAELVVELQRHWAHGVFDPRALYAYVEAVAHLALILSVEFAAQESGNVFGLHGVDRRPAQVAVERRQLRLAFENNVGGILALIHAPVIDDTEAAMNRAEPACKTVQSLVQPLDLQRVGAVLRPRPVGDFSKGIIDEP